MALGGVVTDIKPTFTVNCSNSDMSDIVRDAVSLKKTLPMLKEQWARGM